MECHFPPNFSVSKQKREGREDREKGGKSIEVERKRLCERRRGWDRKRRERERRERGERRGGERREERIEEREERGERGEREERERDKEERKRGVRWEGKRGRFFVVQIITSPANKLVKDLFPPNFSASRREGIQGERRKRMKRPEREGENKEIRARKREKKREMTACLTAAEVTTDNVEEKYTKIKKMQK
jgi:hypothetical protein